jgi:hypothetical protein
VTSTPLSSIDQWFRLRKTNKETSELNCTIDQDDLPDLLKVFQEWGEEGIKKKGGGGELKYDIFDVL